MTNSRALNYAIWFGLILIGLAVFGWLSSINFLLFHGLTELFSISVAIGMGMIAWNTRDYFKNGFFLFLGLGFFFIGIIDLFHTITYKGMGVWPAHDANLPTQFWIAARYLESVTFLIATFFIKRPVNVQAAISGFFLAFVLLILGPISGFFPDCYVEDQGMTAFKIISEYVVSAILVIALARLYQHRTHFSAYPWRLIVSAILLTIVSEVSFTLYIGVYDLANVFGHYFKLLAFYMIYKAIIETGLRQPFSTLFRELRENEIHLKRTLVDWQAILENTEQSFVLIDPDYSIRAFNSLATKRAQAVFGRALQTGESILNYVQETQLESFKSRFQAALKGQIARVELDMKNMTGSDVWFSFSFYPVGDPDNPENILGVCFSTLDITRRKQAQLQLSESEALYRSLFELNQAIKLIVDPETGQVVDANSAACQFYGYSREALKSISVFDINQSPRAEIEQNMKYAEQGQKLYFTFRHQLASGEIRDVEIYSGPVVVQGKRLLYSIVHDISKRIEMENALTREKELAQRYLDIAPVIILALDRTGRITLLNKQGAHILECDQNDAIGQKWIDTFIPESEKAHVQCIFEDAISGNLEPYAMMENQIKTNQNKYIHVKWHNTLLHDAKGEIVGVLCSAEDITERKQAEQALHESQALLLDTGRMARVGGWMLDISSQALTWTDEMYRIFEVDSDYQPTYEKLLNFYEPESRSVLESAMTDLLEHGNPYDLELRFCTAKGNERWLHAIGRAYHENGRLVKIAGAMQDITARKQSEQTLLIYELIFSSAVDAISFVDTTYHYRLVNQAYEHFSGVKRAQLLNRTVADYLGQDVFEKYVKDNFDRCLQGQTVRYQEWFDYPTLGRRFVDVTYHPLRNKDGEIIGLVANTRDITDLKLAEETYRTLANSIPGLVFQFVQHTDGTISVPFVNDAINEYSGLRPEDVIANPALFLEPLHPEDLPRIQEAIAESAANLTPFSVEHRLKPTGGPTRWFQVRSIPQKKDNGDIIWNGVSIEMTEQKLAEAELLKSQSILERAEEISDFGSYEIDFATNMCTLSDGWLKIHGCQTRTRTLDEMKPLAHPDDLPRIEAALAAAIRNEKPYELEHRIRREDNDQLRIIKANGKVIFNASGQPLKMYGSVQDITDRKQAELKLQASERALQEANRTKDKFFSIIGHDLKNAYISIMTSAQMLGGDERLEPEEFKMLTSELQLIAGNQLKLLENLLEWARLQSDRMEFKPERIKLSGLVEQTIHVMYHQARNKNVDITSTVAADMEVWADYKMIETVFRNFISNGIKYTRAGGEVIISARPIQIEALSDRPNEMVEVSIRDTGVGISERGLERLFRIDSSYKTAGTSGEKGTGLGLILCKDFIEKQGGTLTLESEKNVGTTIRFTLPICESP